MNEYSKTDINGNSTPAEPPSHVAEVGQQLDKFLHYLHDRYGVRFVGVALIPAPNMPDGCNDALGITTLCDHCHPGVNDVIVKEMMEVLGKHIPTVPPPNHRH